MKTVSIMIVGVGGQGSLLASKLLGKLLVSEGYDVKVSEIHGMSQRGGSVVTYVKYGEKVWSPVIETGEADYVVSFEKLEAARYIEYLKPAGTVIVNSQQIDPMPVIIGAEPYPDNILDVLRDKGVNVVETDALAKAVEAGNAKSVNIVLMGILAQRMDIPKEKWLEAIGNTVNPKFVEVNKKAFEIGYTL